MSGDPSITSVYKIVVSCDQKVSRMLDGLYGAIDKPGSGFIADTNKRLNNLEGKKEARVWLVRTIIGTILVFFVTAALALAKGLIGN